MNDIDRSVESMDFAMRRRFAFKEVSVSDRLDMIRKDKILGKSPDEILRRLENLNLCILSIQGLSSAYQIGAAYFLKLKNYLKTIIQLPPNLGRACGKIIFMVYCSSIFVASQMHKKACICFMRLFN